MDEFGAAFHAANEALSRLYLHDKKEQEVAATQLANSVESMFKEKPSADIMDRSMAELHRRLFDLIHSNNPTDRSGAILAIDKMVCFADEDAQLFRYANYLRVVLPSKDMALMKEASATLGKIVSRGGSGLYEIVEFEIGRVFQWLQEKGEVSQTCACLVAEALLLNASSISTAYISTLFDAFWTLLRDTKSTTIQEAATKTVKASLMIMKLRYDPASLGLFAQRTLSSLHEELKGSAPVSAMLVLSHLISTMPEALNLENCGDLFDLLIVHVHGKNQIIRQQAFELIPALAAQMPKRFAERYLERWISVLVDALKKEKDRIYSLMSIASTANALGAAIVPFLGILTPSLRSLLGASGKGRGEEHWLFSVISSLAEASKGEFFACAKALVPLILQQDSLTDAGVVAIVASMRSAPEVVPWVEDKILAIAATEISSANQTRTHLAIKLVTSTLFPRAFLQTSLARTLCEMVDGRRGALPAETRLLAAKGLICHARPGHKPGVFCESPADVNRVVGRVLVSCVLEDNQSYVESILDLLNQPCFDRHWAIDASLQNLFALFNAPFTSARARLIIIQISTRISSRLRANLRPLYRATILSLMASIKPSGTDSESAEAAFLLNHLVKVDDSLVRPYTGPIIDLLLARLSSSSVVGSEEARTRFSMAALGILAHLVGVSPNDYLADLEQLLDVLSGLVQDMSAEQLRLAALHCLSVLLRNVDRDRIPMPRMIALIQTVTLLLRIESVQDVRNEALRLLGIIGAIDPYRMRANELALASVPETEEAAISPDAMSDEQYPVVAIGVLLRILKDSSMMAHHHAAIQALVYIFRSVRARAASFLGQTLPVLLSAVRMEASSGAGNGPEFLYQSLAHIVTSVGLHIRPFTAELLSLMSPITTPSLDQASLPSILVLGEALVSALKGECIAEMENVLLLPSIRLLHMAAAPIVQQRALRLIGAFGTAIEGHLPSLCHGLLNLQLTIEASPQASETHFAILRLVQRLLDDLDWSEQVPALLRLIAGALEGASEDGRVRILALDVASQLMRPRYQSITWPHVPFLARLADQYQMPALSFAGDSIGSPMPIGQHSVGLTADLEANSGSDLTGGPTVLWKKLALNEGNLKRAWEGHLGCMEKEEWWEWWRRFGLELIRESPSQSIRACSIIAAAHQPIIRDLFNVAFLSCWTSLSAQVQDELISALEEALASQEVPAEVIQAFLNLAEFMEHEDQTLSIDITTLGAYAIRCHAYAKALYYKELEFQANPSPGLVEAMISLNSQLQLPDAASGILEYAQHVHGVRLKESWHEKLQQWDQALAAYEERWKLAPTDMEALLGLFRCRLALGDWGGLTGLAGQVWTSLSVETQATVAPWAASSAWGLGSWSMMGQFVGRIPEDSIDGSFFRAILAARDGSYDRVDQLVQLTRERLDADLTAMINESYSRAYRTTVRVQMLAELEEVVEYQSSTELRKAGIRDTWSKRLLDCQETVDVWQRMLKTRSLVIRPTEEQDLWIRFAGLCRRMHRPLLSRHVLLTLLGEEAQERQKGQLIDLSTASAAPPVVYALLEHYWDTGERERALAFMRQYSRHLAAQLDSTLQSGKADSSVVEESTKMLARCYVRLGKWQKACAMGEHSLTSASSSIGLGDDQMAGVLEAFLTATSYDRNSRKAWHGWALTNYDLATIHEQRPVAPGVRARTNPWVVPAIQGFFRSIALAAADDDPDGALQDSLRLLTLWFRYGSQPEVNAAVGDGFFTVPVDNWLPVIPQLIARIHVPSPQVRRLVHHVLADIGRQHPQALLYPLTVASKAQSISRRTSALALLDKMKAHAANLVEQAVMVSQELIRVAITWEELWYEALEEASRLYFGPDHNIPAMLQTLEGLHSQLERGRETQRENAFFQAHGQALRQARELCQKYKKSANEDELKQAWDLYYQVFRRINKLLPQLSVIELENASPRLLHARDLDIPIPGTYRVGVPIVTIASVAPVMSVIASKQRPRKLVFIGSDGKKYKFLLKGHEDLRQDERVMQLFGLVNSLLATDRETAKRHLAIQRFAVVPLSQNTGLIGWVPHCDTIHTLIRDYREARGILLSAEHRLMLQFAPDYDHLSELQKVEVFLHAMANTDGLDLNRIMWRKSQHAEFWLERRTTYTRSLAVMSMVGYVLGLGDRHPSNLMIDQVTGRVVHIDFGDCFEAAQHREKFPERVPFRLTRMLVKAMEVSQTEGTFRIVCEHTMRVLRENKDSVMAVLEAFVYDPLINWRILTKPSEPNTPRQGLARDPTNYSGALGADAVTSGVFPENFSTTRRARLGDEINRLEEESINRPEAVNAGALNVVTHVSNKLTGREYGTADALDIQAQVNRLILDAIKIENLCQAYVGWCPFW